jgi:hypothetical protein
MKETSHCYQVATVVSPKQSWQLFLSKYQIGAFFFFFFSPMIADVLPVIAGGQSEEVPQHRPRELGCHSQQPAQKNEGLCQSSIFSRTSIPTKECPERTAQPHHSVDAA